MTARLDEVGNAEEREAVENGYYSSIEKTGEKAAAQLLKQGPTVDACKYALTLVDGGSMNMEQMAGGTSGQVQRDLNALVDWAKTH